MSATLSVISCTYLTQSNTVYILKMISTNAYFDVLKFFLHHIRTTILINICMDIIDKYKVFIHLLQEINQCCTDYSTNG